MRINSHKNLFAVIYLCSAVFYYGCGTTPENADTLTGTTANHMRPQPSSQTSHRIAIVNASANIINTIKYKPCGSSPDDYQYLTGNLRPSEKFTINIYSQCVDLLATNAFKKKLVDAQNINLTTTKTWTIK